MKLAVAHRSADVGVSARSLTRASAGPAAEAEGETGTFTARGLLLADGDHARGGGDPLPGQPRRRVADGDVRPDRDRPAGDDGSVDGDELVAGERRWARRQGEQDRGLAVG